MSLTSSDLFLIELEASKKCPVYGPRWHVYHDRPDMIANPTHISRMLCLELETALINAGITDEQMNQRYSSGRPRRRA